MLPQPNFGRDKDPVEPDKADADGAMPRKKLLRLQIAMWIQVVCAVIAGNVLAFYTFSLRGATVDELTSIYEDSGASDNPAETAQAAYELYQSTNFLVSNLVIAGFAVVAAIIAALCTVRFKSRLKAVRWWAVGATAVLFIIGMFMSTVFLLYVAPWVFASVLALWWLFASDIRYWMSESASRGTATSGDDKPEKPGKKY
jgi:small-conductance mechanosensitive channel